MSTIKGIGLQNFRIFKDMTNFEFAPITVLTGANNSGKSSVIKALLLLAENAKKNKFLELDFSSQQNDLHKLGSFEDVLNKNSESDEITFEIDFEINLKDYTEIYNSYYSDYKEVETDLIFNFFPSNEFKISLKFVKDNKNIRIDLLELINKNENNLVFYISTHLIEGKKREKNVQIATSSIIYFIKVLLNLFAKYPEGKIIKYTGGHYDEETQEEITEEFSDFNLQNLLKFSSISFNVIKNEILHKKLENFDRKDVTKFLNYINSDIFYKIGSYDLDNNIFENINYSHFNHFLDYIIPLTLKDRYLSKNSDFNPDYALALGDLTIKDIINEEYLNFYKEAVAPSVISIYNEAIKSLEFEYLEVLKANSQRIYLNQWQGTPFNGLIAKYLKLSNPENKKVFLLKWLGKEGFDLCDDINFHALGYGTVIKVIKNQKEMDLADLGYGATQILALLLKIITSSYGSNIILEEPEINLHPKLQSKLADLLVDAHKEFSQNFIVETHSEYFVRKLQYLTAKKEITPKEISLYYFYEPDKIPEGEKQVKKIEFEESGFLSTEFGTGFYDEADKIAIDLHILKNTHKN